MRNIFYVHVSPLTFDPSLEEWPEIAQSGGRSLNSDFAAECFVESWRRF